MKAVIITPSGSVVSLREQPSATSEEIAYLESGDAVDAVATQGDWTRVIWDGNAGWVSSNFVMTQSDELNGKLRNKLKKALKTAVNPVAATKATLKATKQTIKATANPLEATKNLKKTVKSLVNSAKVATGTNGVDGELDGIKDAIVSFFSSSSSATTKSDYTVGQTLYVNTQTDPLVMHVTPSKAGAKVTSVPRASAVSVADATLTSEGGYHWLKVNYGAYTGYVANEYLSVVKPTVATTTTATTTTTVADSITTGGETTISPTTNNNNAMTLTENAKKYLKWGIIGVGAITAGYFGYKAIKGGSGSKKKKSSLSGISKKPILLN